MDENKLERNTMKMTKLLSTVLLMMLSGFAIAGVGGCTKSESGGNQARQYTCPMHPEVLQDKPGKCPKCGMKLVEKR